MKPNYRGRSLNLEQQMNTVEVKRFDHVDRSAKVAYDELHAACITCTV